MRLGWLLLVLVSLSNYAFSQEEDSCYAGVYLTQDDFINNRLSHTINTGVKGNKLDFSFPADLTLAVKLITQDTTLKFEAGSIYGFNDCKKVFRYFRGGKDLKAQEDYYRVEEIEGLVIYSSAFVSGEEIFYSLDLSSPIHRLTLKDLKRDFEEYPAFIEAAKKLNADPGEGLAARDEQGNYRINVLYRELAGAK